MSYYKKPRALTNAELSNQFDKSINEPNTKYGLPKEIKFCRSCVISNQRPNSAIEFKHTASSNKSTIRMGTDGVCDACRVAENKRGPTGQKGRASLSIYAIVTEKDDGSYDCLVLGSGERTAFTKPIF